MSLAGSTPPFLSTLPPELLTIIVDQVVASIEPSPHLELTRLCRVSRSLLDICRAKLYHTLPLKRHSHDDDGFGSNVGATRSDWDDEQDGDPRQHPWESWALSNTLDSCPHLASIVRRVDIQDRDHMASLHSSEQDLVEMSHLLAVCPHLDELTFRGWPEMKLGGIVNSLNGAGRKLRLLSIRSSTTLYESTERSKEARRNKLALATFLDKQIAMEELDLVASNHPLDTFTEPPTWQLRTLRCALSHLLHFTLHSHHSLQSLTLDLSRVPAPQFLSLAPFTRLESLTITQRSGSAPSTLQYISHLSHLLPGCPTSLSHLELVHRLLNPEDSIILADALPLIPTSIRKLDLTSFCVQSAPLIKYLQGRTCPHLKELIVLVAMEIKFSRNEPEMTKEQREKLFEVGAKVGVLVSWRRN